jgi:hypothetical protein
MHDRGNGLGGGFAVYGCYPEFADWHALHIMYMEAGVRADYLHSRLLRLEGIGAHEDWGNWARLLAAKTEGYSYATLQELFAQIGFTLVHEGGTLQHAAESALARLNEAMAIADSLEPGGESSTKE